MRVMTNNDGTCSPKCVKNCPNTVKGKPNKKCLAYGTHGANLLIVKNLKDFKDMTLEEKMERNRATKNKKREM
jgi:hypothetical protein